MTEPSLDEQIEEALHPERNGLLIKKGVAEGARYEHIVKESLAKLISDQVAKARIDEAMNCRKMTTGCDPREYDMRLVARIAELKEGSKE